MSRDHWLRDKISYENLEELKRHFTVLIQSMDDDVEKEKTEPFTCDSKDRSFTISAIVLYRVKEKLGVEIQYKIYRCDYSEHRSYDIMNLRDADDLVHAIFYCLYDMDLCRECFTLTESKHRLCMECIPQKIRDEYARVHKNQEAPSCCPICLDPVYHSHLSCGHFLHKTCFVMQNSRLWYSKTITNTMNLKCPICRKVIQDEDKNEFFLYHSDHPPS